MNLLQKVETWIPREMGVFLHVFRGDGDGGSGVNRKGEMGGVGRGLDAVEFESVRFKIQKIADKMEIMARATIVIRIREAVVLKCRIHTVKADLYA